MLIYVSHPFHEEPKRGPRLARWLRWCYSSTSRNISFAVAEADPPEFDVEHCIRSARGNLDLLSRCDGMVMLGHVTPRMQIQREAAERNGLPILDLTHLGPEPGARMPEEFFSIYEQRSAVA